MNTKTLFSSKSMDWNTPKSLVDFIQSYGVIGLDPCSNDNSVVGAEVNYSIEDDGLSKSWRGYGLVFINPPYSREVAKWTEKAVKEFTGYISGADDDECVMLLPSRTETKWFQKDVLGQSRAICFIKGRLTFLGAENGAPFPSVLVYFGDHVSAFHDHFREIGKVVIL